MARPKIGDVIEVPTKKGYSYAQYTHKHPEYGELIRVFDVIYDSRPSEIDKVVKEPVWFSTFFPVGPAVAQNIFAIVGHAPVRDELKPFPVFRTGIENPETREVKVWWLWDGGKESKRVDDLTPEQWHYPIRGIWNDTLLIERIESGWRPENWGRGIVPDDKESAEDTREDSQNDGPQIVRHYLYFSSEQASQDVANQLRAQGLDVEDTLGPDEDNWLVLVTLEIVSAEEAISGMREKLEIIADENGGEYDGWEATVGDGGNS